MADGSRSFDETTTEDPHRLAEIYRAHAAYVWRVLRHLGVDDSDLDDAVQETFVVVQRRLDDFEGRASLRTWLYAVAVRVASTQRRSRRRELARRESAGALMHGDARVDPEAALGRAEAAGIVDRLLDELDPAKRAVFVLAEIEGVKVPQISRILGVNPRTVHSRLRLARARFGEALRRLQAREDGARRVARLAPRRLLDAAANDRPAPARRQAAFAALVVRLEDGAMPWLPGWQTLSLSSGAGSGWLPAVLVLGGVGIVAGGGAWAGRSSADVASATAAADGPAPAPADEATAREATAERPTGSSRPDPVGPADPGSAAPASPAPAVGGPAAATTDPPRSWGRPAPSRAAPPAEAPAIAEDAASTLAEETALVTEARTALARSDVAAALAALDRHARRFPDGILRDEARSTRLRAYCSAGRTADARALADRLAPGRDDSAWHDIVAANCR